MVSIERRADGMWVITPAGAPTVLDAAAAIDVLVLEVSGGHLSWSLLAGQPIPAAVIDDLELAQEWIWAIYGEQVALTIADLNSATVGLDSPAETDHATVDADHATTDHSRGITDPDRSAVYSGTATELDAEPALPALVAVARRLAYAHWAARWWPASTIDGIAPLDEQLLDDEIATLTEQCELIVDGADAALAERILVPAEIVGRAKDYALAAGSGTESTGGLVLGRGAGGWDWRRCPPGVLDASERAVSWELTRAAGVTTVRVNAVAAPQLGVIPPHLRPRALITLGTDTIDVELHPVADIWTGRATGSADSVRSVQVYVPGVGAPDNPDPTGPDMRRRLREFAAARLRRASAAAEHTNDPPLLAEIAAAASDSDF